MVIHFNNNKFRVRFEYSCKKNGKIIRAGKALDQAYHKQIVTTCIIQQMTKDGWQTVTNGVSYRNKLDIFDKGKGRRNSLALALAAKIEPFMDKNFRSLVWTEYFNNHRDGWELRGMYQQ